MDKPEAAKRIPCLAAIGATLLELAANLTTLANNNPHFLEVWNKTKIMQD